MTERPPEDPYNPDEQSPQQPQDPARPDQGMHQSPHDPTGQQPPLARAYPPNIQRRSSSFSWMPVFRWLRNGLAMVGALVVVGYLAYLFMMFLFILTASADRQSEFQRKTVQRGATEKYIVELPISGMIVSSDQGLMAPGGPDSDTLLRLREIRKDPRVAGVLLRINSPGGGITASDVIYNEIKRIQADGIPVVALFEDLAASGGYYVAAPADHIVAHPTTLTGSIGVLIMSYEISGLLEKIGVNDQTIKAGKNKDMLSLSKPLSEPQQKMLEAMVAQMHERFIKIVSEGRNMDEQKLREIADGRILLADQALKAGLVDEVGYYDNAVSKLASLAGMKDEPRIVRYERPAGLFSVFGASEGVSPPEARLIDAAVERLKAEAQPRMMYMWRPQGQ